MTMFELLQIQPIMKKISAQALPLSISYRLSKMFSRLERELQFFYTQRSKIQEECAEKNGKVYIAKPGKEEEFDRQSQELLMMEVDIDDIQPVEIPATTNIALSCNEIKTLERFIKITED